MTSRTVTLHAVAADAMATHTVAPQSAGPVTSTDLRLRLRQHPSAPGAARRSLRAMCAALPVPQSTVDDAALVAGEMMANSARLGASGHLNVVFEVAGEHITVRVADNAGARRALRTGSTTGVARSWSIIRRLASSWGVASNGAERQVWAVIGAAN